MPHRPRRHSFARRFARRRGRPLPETRGNWLGQSGTRSPYSKFCRLMAFNRRRMEQQPWRFLEEARERRDRSWEAQGKRIGETLRGARGRPRREST